MVDRTQSGIVRHSTATVSSPTTLLASRNVAIDCVQLQVRVHSTQQRSRPTSASPRISKKWRYLCKYLVFEPFSRRRQISKQSGPIRLQPGPVATPAHRVTMSTFTLRANCAWIWRQNGYYAICSDVIHHVHYIWLLIAATSEQDCSYLTVATSEQDYSYLLSKTAAIPLEQDYSYLLSKTTATSWARLQLPLSKTAATSEQDYKTVHVGESCTELGYQQIQQHYHGHSLYKWSGPTSLELVSHSGATGTTCTC